MGSVGLNERSFFFDAFVGFSWYAFRPALATFLAPWIFMDFMSLQILEKVCFFMMRVS